MEQHGTGWLRQASSFKILEILKLQLLLISDILLLKEEIIWSR
jgi:hypothetical protein